MEVQSQAGNRLVLVSCRRLGFEAGEEVADVDVESEEVAR